jgi:hypothetical protein
MVEGYSVRQLSSQCGHSPAKLYRLLGHCLEQAVPEADLCGCEHFILDGTFIHRPRTIIALMNAQTHTIVTGQYGVSESSKPQLLRYFGSLKQKGLVPRSFTVDGNPQVTKTLRTIWPDTVIQRCLVHISRQGLAWCRTSPKTTHARKLRSIFLQINKIHTLEARDRFLMCWCAWEDTYGSQIRYRRETGPVFSDIKRARSMLIRALPDMFSYFDDPDIPTSTNGLEGYFSRLKAHYRGHRGLSRENRRNYFHWYLNLAPK